MGQVLPKFLLLDASHMIPFGSGGIRRFKSCNTTRATDLKIHPYPI